MIKDKNLAETAYQLQKEEIIPGKRMPGDKQTGTAWTERFGKVHPAVPDSHSILRETMENF